MTAPRTLWIDGVGCWAPGWPDWAAARAALRDEWPAGAATARAPAQDPAGAASAARRPAPALLAANERRRAPDAVLLALEVATAAVAASGHAAGTLRSVFTSAHGDLPIIDALCRTLASDPLLVSPTRFHHSVHNAASGYWAIASGSMAASTALAAYEYSFAAGLLEAAVMCATEDAPVLLVACDTEAVGALASTNRSRGLLAFALVLAPRPGPTSRWRLGWQLQPGAATPTALHSAAAQVLAGNAMADALPLAQRLAWADGAVGARQALQQTPEAAAQRRAAPIPGAGAGSADPALDLALGPALKLALQLLPLPDPTPSKPEPAAASSSDAVQARR